MRVRRQRGDDGGGGGFQSQGKPGGRTRTASLARKAHPASPATALPESHAEPVTVGPAAAAMDPFGMMTGAVPGASGALAETIQRAHNGDGASIDDVATAAVEHKRGGQPVDPAVRSQVEPHLGADLGGVRVHPGGDAAAASSAIGARAFAYQSDVFLGAGESPSDVRLMAHELIHVVQQGAAAPHAQRKITVGAANDPAEAEADRVADQVAGGAPATGAVLIEDGAPAKPHQMTRSAALSQLRQAGGAESEPAIAQFVAEHGSESVASLERQGRAALGGIKPGSAPELLAPLAAKLKGADGAAPGGVGAGATAAMKPATAATMVQRLGDGVALDGTMAAAAGDVYGADLSGVRVHTEAAAAHLAADHGARAFTIGNHVAFGAGEHNPGTPVGDALMAHELAHVVQQQGADPTVQRKPLEVEGSEDAEDEADQAARACWPACTPGRAQRHRAQPAACAPAAASRSSAAPRRRRRRSRARSSASRSSAAEPRPRRSTSVRRS